jgi:hypothetical protein
MGARGGECLQSVTIAIDAGDPDTCCEQGPMQRTVQVYDVVDNGTRNGGGTEGSNPAPSNVESIANQISSP